MNAEQVQKLLSILLLAIFGLPLVSPFLAFVGDGDTGLPACCRKNGKHHCTMSMSERGQIAGDGIAFSSHERCPYCPGSVVATHADVVATAPAEAIFASLVSHPTGVAQTESKWRIARDRSRQKRGPPINLL